MLACARTVAFDGLDSRLVEAQCVLSPGLPAFHVVGLPDKAVSEARERVRAALSSLAIALPPKRITINLSPADLPKEGSHFDLPIALALLAALDLIPAEDLSRTVSLGELSLDGALGPVVGASVFSVLQDSIMRATDYWCAVFGGVILLLVLVFPQGIAGFFQQVGGGWHAWRSRSPARQASVPTAMEKQA